MIKVGRGFGVGDEERVTSGWDCVFIAEERSSLWVVCM